MTRNISGSDDKQMIDTKAEIAKVKKALSETESPYLKMDYEKYLKKLYKKIKTKWGLIWADQKKK